MNSSQDIRFYWSTNQRFTAHVIQRNDSAFTAEVAEAAEAYDLEGNPCIQTFQKVCDPEVDNAEAAFRHVLNFVLQQTRINPNGEATLVRVNNPCNCELLAIQDQTRIVEEVVGYPVEVVENQEL